jgi:hypothetical protein
VKQHLAALRTDRLKEARWHFGLRWRKETRERVPLHWAATQTNLGVVLSRFGEREGGTDRLEEAVVAFRAALEESTREGMPLAWAAMQNNLSLALALLASRRA